MSESAARWVVSGRVQGVGFRWFTVRLAERIGVRGWVSNLADGRVEVVARGSDQQLSLLEEGLRTGPRMAHVEGVEKYEIPHEDIDIKSFGVK